MEIPYFVMMPCI